MEGSIGGNQPAAMNDSTRTERLTVMVDQAARFYPSREDLVTWARSARMEENQTRAFLHSAHEGVLAVDAQGRVTLFNPAAERLMGIAAGSVLGLHVMEVIPNTRLHIVLKTGEAELDQIQDTGTTTVLTNRVPVRNSLGEVVGAMATFRDIGEIKRLGREVAALKETRTLLEAIVNSTQDAISVVDEKGLGILINPAYTRLTGLSESEVLQRPATVDIAEGESMHLQVLRTRQAVKHVRNNEACASFGQAAEFFIRGKNGRKCRKPAPVNTRFRCSAKRG
ncbi:MAG: PAS domain-containing protein [Syntrophobacteraceae bacterium]